METLIREDDLDKILFTDVVTDNNKKGVNWIITLYDDNLNYESIKNNLETFPNMKSFIFQIEIGEITKKKHFHACITLNISTFKPLSQFKKRFQNVHIQSAKNVEYWQSYCCKNQSADPNYEPFYYNIVSSSVKLWKENENKKDDLLQNCNY